MFKRWLMKNIVTLIVLLIFIIVALYLITRSQPIRIGADNQLLAQQFMANTTFDTASMKADPVIKEGTRSWIEAAKNDNTTLFFELTTGQIEIRENTGDKRWSATPTEEELVEDGTKGTWSTGLKSPFTFNYIIEGTVNEKLSNPVAQKAIIQWRKIDQGIGISYDMQQIGFKFYLEYTLTEDGFHASVPQHGILETKTNRLISFQLLPFFNAAMKGKSEGYLFVPDGPGGLITFNKKLVKNILPYDYAVFGFDYSVPFFDNRAYRTDIAYPVFGMKKDQDGFMGVVEEGQYSANIVASPAGIDTQFYRVNTKFTLRRIFERAATMNKYVKTFENNIMAEPIKVRYILLERDHADYVAMASTYRNYLMKHNNAALLPEKASEPPLVLDVLMAAGEKTAMGKKLIVATKLADLEVVTENLHEKGIKDVRLYLAGWNTGGYSGDAPNNFPIEPAIGGNSGFLKLQEKVKKLGGSIALHDDITLADDKDQGGFSMSRDSVYDISGNQLKYWLEGDWYSKEEQLNYISPKVIYERYFPRELKAYKKLELESVSLTGMANGVYSDFHKNHVLTRNDTAKIFMDMMKEAKQSIGSLTTGPFVNAIGQSDRMTGFPITGNGDLLIDTTVPFYPIAVHGLVTYTAEPSNQLIDPRNDFLRGIEYGVLPYYIISTKDASELSRTGYAGFFQTKYVNVEKKILSEYEIYRETLGDVWNKPITDHRKAAEGVFVTTYSTGKSVWTNYNENEVIIEGVKIAPLSFAVKSGGTNND